MKLFSLLFGFFSLTQADTFILEPDTLLYYDSAYVLQVIIGPSDCMGDAPCECEEEHPCYLTLFYENRRHEILLHYVAGETDVFTFSVEIPIPQNPPERARLSLYDWRNTLRGSVEVRMGYREDRPPLAIIKTAKPEPLSGTAWRVDGRRW